MNSDLVRFDFDGRAMAVYTDDDGELLFPVQPMEVVLGENLSRSIRQSKVYDRDIDYRVKMPDWAQRGNFEFPRRSKHATFLTESGLYKAILRSNAPHARAFQNKVTREVLPSIRIYGTYPPPVESAEPKAPENHALLESARKCLNSAYETGCVPRVEAARGWRDLMKRASEWIGVPLDYVTVQSPAKAQSFPGQLPLALVPPLEEDAS